MSLASFLAYFRTRVGRSSAVVGGKKLVIFCTQGSLDCLGHSGKVGNGGVEKRVGEEDRKADNERGLIESFLPTEQTDSQASRGVRQPARSHE